MGLFDWLGYGDSPTPVAPVASVDPRAMRQQAFFQGLTELGAGLLAAGQRRPLSQPSMLPQALTGFNRGYNNGLQNQYAQNQLEQQADQTNRWQGVVNGQTPLQGIDTRTRSLLGVLGPQLGPQALATLATRPQGQALTREQSESLGLDTRGGTVVYQRTANGQFEPINGPGLTGANEAARVGITGLEVPGQGGSRIFPYGMPGGGRPALPGASGGVPGPLPGGARPAPAPGPGQRAAMEANGIDPDAGPGGPNDPYRDPNFMREYRAAEGVQTAQAQPGPQVTRLPNGGAVLQSPYPPASSQEGRLTGQHGENQAKLIQDRFVTPATSALNILQTTTQMRRLLDEGNVVLGPGSGVRNYFAEVLRSWGGDAGARVAERIQGANFEALRGLSARQVLDGLGGSLGTGISNADRDYISSTVPNPFQSEQSFRRFVELLEDRALGSVDRGVRGYRQSAPNYNDQSDPFMADVRNGLSDLGIDPANIRAGRRQARQPANGGAAESTPPPVEPPQRPTVRNGVERGVETDIPRSRETLPTPGQISMMTPDQLGALAGRVSEMTAEQQVALQRRLDLLERAAPRNSGRTGR